MSDTQPSERPRRLRKAALVVLFSLLVPLVGGELAIRVYAHFFFPKLMVIDDALGWRHAANKSKPYTNEDGETVLTVQNEFGNRGPAHPIERAEGRRRVLVLGDSFTEGVQVAEEQLFTALLEASAPDLEVINTGVGGWGNVQQFLYLREEGLRFQPDHVLLMCFENDLDDNVTPYTPAIYKRPYCEAQDGGVRLIEECENDAYLQFVAPVPGRALLLRYSLLFYAFNDRFWQPSRSARLESIANREREAIDWDTKYTVFFDVLERLQRLTQDAGATFDVVLIPFKQGVLDGRSDIQERALAGCAERGIAVRSLLEPLARAQEAGLRPYFDGDIHFTAAGHRVAAEELAKLIEERRGGSD